MRLTFLGHACFHLRTKQGGLLFDPYLTGNPLAAAKAEEVTADAILVSHGHSDHLGDAISISKRLDIPIIAPFELALYCEGQGAQTHAMHIGGDYAFPFGWVKLTPAWHGSSVLEDDTIIYTGQPCGFLVRTGEKTVYFAGDTGLFGDMELLGDLYDIDLALLPIGGNFVMGIEDAARAAKMLRAKVVVPMHYNTFELIRQDPAEFAERLQVLRIDCRILEPGEATEI
ncbi:MAG: metal-dependent hydrolase [Firmicutes bacterium]|jgi:L-ascorbate metabolism protein UlaG (beta-lactamase superfamily)|nr:metal-dependent hydrolase [Bacillota bacterium]